MIRGRSLHFLRALSCGAEDFLTEEPLKLVFFFFYGSLTHFEWLYFGRFRLLRLILDFCRCRKLLIVILAVRVSF